MCSPFPPDWDETSINSPSGGGSSSSSEIDYNYVIPPNCNNNNNSSELGLDHSSTTSSTMNLTSGLGYLYTPELTTIESTVKWGFLLHAYGFACLFFFLAFYAFFSILNLRSQLSSRPYMSTINSFLCLLGISRAGVLFIDPYGLKKTLPIVMGNLLWDLGFPCLISSFSLIQIAFLQLTQLEVGPEKLRKKTCLSIIITIHFVTVIASAIYSNINPDLLIMKFVFQLGFSIWGLLLCGSFLYAGRRVLGILGTPGNDGPAMTAVNEKGVAGLMMAGLMAPGQNLASSLTAALAPTLLQSSTPKIKITDENDRTISVASDSSRLNEPFESGSSGRPSTPIPGTSKSNGQNSLRESSCSSGNHVRPPSPVLPRKKSGGTSSALRNCPPSSTTEVRLPTSSNKSRRLSFRRDSSSQENELFSATRKKSLTWSENNDESGGSAGGGGGPSSSKGKRKKHQQQDEDDGNTISLTVSSDKTRRGSKKSADFTAAAEGNAERSGSTSAGLATESLLGGGTDYTLQSILSHIAYVNQTALDYRLNRKLSRKNQVHKVIKYTSITALLGVLLCVGEIIRILSPYGIMASNLTPPTPWPWFTYQSICRIIEFAMGAVIANITKQPVNRPHGPHHHYPYSFRHKHPRESLYL